MNCELAYEDESDAPAIIIPTDWNIVKYWRVDGSEWDWSVSSNQMIPGLLTMVFRSVPDIDAHKQQQQKRLRIAQDTASTEQYNIR